jgi:hypothetical protein
MSIFGRYFLRPGSNAPTQSTQPRPTPGLAGGGYGSATNISYAAQQKQNKIFMPPDRITPKKLTETKKSCPDSTR